LFVPPSVTPFSLDWYQALAVPQRAKPTPALLDLQTRLVFTVAPVAPVSIGWYADLSKPAQAKPNLASMRQSSEHFPWATIVANVATFGWFARLAEPTRRKPQLAVTLQPSENTMYIRGNLPFATTGPLFLNGTTGRGQSVWRVRARNSKPNG
jgi:hypothetical protein